jgi:hypothetical protein
MAWLADGFILDASTIGDLKILYRVLVAAIEIFLDGTLAPLSHGDYSESLPS